MIRNLVCLCVLAGATIAPAVFPGVAQKDDSHVSTVAALVSIESLKATWTITGDAAGVVILVEGKEGKYRIAPKAFSKIGFPRRLTAAAKESRTDNGRPFLQIVIGAECISQDKAHLEYRMLFGEGSPGARSDQKGESIGWYCSDVLVSRGIDEPYLSLGVSAPGYGTLFLALQRIDRTKKGGIVTDTYFNDCPSPNMGNVPFEHYYSDSARRVPMAQLVPTEK